MGREGKEDSYMPGLIAVDLKRSGQTAAYIEKLLAQPRWTDAEYKSLKAFLKFSEAERQQALEGISIEALLASRGIHFPTGKRTPQIKCFLPDHADNTASMTLYRSSNRCYCFGCRRKLNTIDLLILQEGYTFGEAMDYLLGDWLRLPAQLLRRAIKKRLAEKQVKLQRQVVSSGESEKPINFRVQAPKSVAQSLPPESAAASSQRQITFSLTEYHSEISLVLTAVAAYYHLQLEEHLPAWRYLTSRGLTRTTILQNKLGYANGVGLVGWLRQQNLSLTLAREIGLLGDGAVERLAGRVILPIFNNEGHVAMLTGRVLPGSTGIAAAWPWQPEVTGSVNRKQASEVIATDILHAPKYLNLRLPKPSFGVFLSATAAQQHSDPLLLVEGPFDYLVATQWGYAAICTWGTAVSQENLHLLELALTGGRIARLLVCFDNDPPKTQPDGTVCPGAGLQATRQLLAQFASARVRAIELPAGFKDIASLAETPQGRRLFDQVISQALAKF